MPLTDVPQDKQFEERIDSSVLGSTIYGETDSLGALQTDEVWRIWRWATFGTQQHKQYADNDSGQVHSWADRVSLFPPVPFVNDFALILNGNASQFGEVAHNAAYIPGSASAFSWGLWTKKFGTGSVTLLDKSLSNTGVMFEIDGAGRLYLELRATGAGDRIRLRVDSVNLHDAQYHLLGFTKGASLAASNISLWVDTTEYSVANANINVLQDSLTGSIANTGPLRIGSNQGGASGGNRLFGIVDEPAIWNAKLTPAEWAQVYNSNNGVIDLKTAGGQIQSNLVSWWRMGDKIVTFPNLPDQQGSSTMVLQSGVLQGHILPAVPPS